MAWLRDQIWLYGFAILLVLVGAALMYIGGTDGESPALTWVGLLLVFAAMLIPLARKAHSGLRGESGDDNET